MKFLIAISSLAFLLGAASADADAEAKCRALHHVDVESGTSYINSQCLLRCIIHGKTTVHNMNEGLPCPLASTGTCHNGACIQGPSGLGHIDIEMVSASVAKAINGYATVCIQNSSVPMTLPIQNRQSCVSCSTNEVTQSTYPVWNSVCSGSSSRLFVPDSRVTFEVWDNHGTGSANKKFIGGASLTIPQLLSHGDNHKELHLALISGDVAGQINARVTWTAAH